MGYLTDYRIIKAPPAAVQMIQDLSEYTWVDEDYLYGVKWYNWSKHLITVSEEFPLHTIVLQGLGEEDDVPWRVYAKNGVLKEGKTVTTFEEPTFE